MSAWKSAAANATSVWKLTHSTDSVDWPVESTFAMPAMPASPEGGVAESCPLQT